jgi:N utilization substance protein A
MLIPFEPTKNFNLFPAVIIKSPPEADDLEIEELDYENQEGLEEEEEIFQMSDQD